MIVPELLKENEGLKQKRIEELEANGYPVYITSAGWLGYSDDKIREVGTPCTFVY